MIELLVRLADEKFIKNINLLSIENSLQILIDKNMNKELNNKQYDS